MAAGSYGRRKTKVARFGWFFEKFEKISNHVDGPVAGHGGIGMGNELRRDQDFGDGRMTRMRG